MLAEEQLANDLKTYVHALDLGSASDFSTTAFRQSSTLPQQWVKAFRERAEPFYAGMKKAIAKNITGKNVEKLVPPIGEEEGFEWKPLARICKRIGQEILPGFTSISSKARRACGNREAIAQEEALAAFQRVPDEVLAMLADMVDELGQSSQFRNMSPTEQDELLKNSIVGVFVLYGIDKAAVDYAADGMASSQKGATARAGVQIANYMHRMFGIKREDAAKGVAKQVSESEMARGNKFLDLLVTAAKKRGLNRTVDVTLDLTQEPTKGSVLKHAQKKFVDSWKKSESADIGQQLRDDRVTRTFQRDLQAGKHFLLDQAGSRVCKTAQDFVDFIGMGQHEDGLPLVISHVANQNMGAFLHEILLDRNINPLLSSDGQQIIPAFTGGQFFHRFHKLDGGKVKLDFEYSIDAVSYVKLLEGMTSFNSSQLVTPGSFKFEVSMVFEPDGRWTMEDPKIHAKNLHQFN